MIDASFVVTACLFTFAASVVVSIGVTRACYRSSECHDHSCDRHRDVKSETLRAYETTEDGLTPEQLRKRKIIMHEYWKGSQHGGPTG